MIGYHGYDVFFFLWGFLSKCQKKVGAKDVFFLLFGLEWKAAKNCHDLSLRKAFKTLALKKMFEAGRKPRDGRGEEEGVQAVNLDGVLSVFLSSLVRVMFIFFCWAGDFI